MVGEEHECIVGGKFVVTEALSCGVLKVVLMLYISFVFLNTVIVCVCPYVVIRATVTMSDFKHW